MKIYIPYWVDDPHGADNPFISTLTDGIKLLSKDVYFVFNKDFFWQSECEDVDIVHIMWPNVFEHQMNECGSNLLNRILYLKDKGVKFVVTCHNLRPHTYNELWQRAYDIVYGNCDIMIHLGEFSKNKCEKIYLKAKHIIIPHHVYDTLYSTLPSKEIARNRMLFSNKYTYVVCFGAFRNDQEKRIVKQIAKFRGVKVLAPCYINLPDGKVRIWRRSGLKWLKMHILYPNVIITGKYVSDEDLPYYYAASDISVIQRPDILNSGNVPLAFLMGKVVVGPNTGNVGPLLMETGNPVYDPNDLQSIKNAISKAVLLTKQGKGLKNREYALKYLSTSVIARKYYDVYRSVCL